MSKAPLYLRLFSLEERILRKIVKRFRGGLVFQAHRLLYHSTLGSRAIKKKKEVPAGGGEFGEHSDQVLEQERARVEQLHHTPRLST